MLNHFFMENIQVLSTSNFHRLDNKIVHCSHYPLYFLACKNCYFFVFIDPLHIQDIANGLYYNANQWLIPYRTKLRRTKVTKFFWGDENFVHIFFINVTVNDRLSANCRDFRNNTIFQWTIFFVGRKWRKFLMVTKILSDEV